MERYYSQAIKTGIVSTGGEIVARTLEVVVDPETGKIAGFLLAPKGKKVISPSDVIFWDQHIIIHDAHDILDTGEILKVKEILSKNIPIIKNKVYTQNKLFLGNVLDFVINPKLFTLTKIIVAKNFLKFFLYDEKIISYQNIIEIKKDGIIVKDPTATVKIKEKLATGSKLRVDAAPTG